MGPRPRHGHAPNLAPAPQVLSVSFFLDSLFAGLALQRMGDCAVRVGIKARAALITAVYRKAFRLNSTTGHDGGNIVSLVRAARAAFPCRS